MNETDWEQKLRQENVNENWESFNTSLVDSQNATILHSRKRTVLAGSLSWCSGRVTAKLVIKKQYLTDGKQKKWITISVNEEL